MFNSSDVDCQAFLFMNPGNGIETPRNIRMRKLTYTFLFMNPGNGIETNQVGL